MKCLGAIAFLTVLCIVCAEDSSSENVETTSEENTREMREYNQQGWRAVENFQPGASGWIPHPEDEASSDTPTPKRRRLRKRKRRPPMISLTDDSDESFQRPRRRMRPQRLEQNIQPWEEMNDEAVGRPYIRRRLTPVYQPSEEIITNEEQVNINPISATIHFLSEEVERPEPEIPTITGEIEDEEKPEATDEPSIIQEDAPSSTSSKPDLKSLLKQNSGGLSLSEILQQKNLSLSELLMGNERAISALTENPTVTTESSVEVKFTTEEADMQSTKYKRLPPSIGLRKNINRNFEQDEESIETMSTKEILEAQRKRLALLHAHKDNRIYKEVTKLDVITEPTTEKRIFVPSHPKYYTSLNFKPDFNPYTERTTEPYTETAVREETTTVMPTTTTPVAETRSPVFDRMSLKPKIKNNLPITSAKLKKITSKQKTKDEDNYPKEDSIPIKAVKIDVQELLDIRDSAKESIKEDAPLKMSINLDELMKDEPKLTTPYENQEMTTQSTLPKHVVTAKEEIMEILKDPISREKLSRILEIRNMTVEELVEQRERGSSQLHLADIFHNKTREPEPKDEPFIGRVNSEYFNSFPVFNRKQKSRVLEDESSSQVSSSSSSFLQLKPAAVQKPKELYTVTSFPTYKIEMDKTNSDKLQPFLWKELYPDLFKELYEDSYKKSESGLRVTTQEYLDNDIQSLESIEDKFSSVSNDKLNVDLDQRIYDDEDEVFINLPTGVKSAILASLAIIGLSLVVFLTILVIFRWSQKQKKRLNYCSSFSSKIKSPILENNQRKTIRTFMNETLGKKKNYYDSHLQSMSDNIWENDRKPSY